MDKLVMYIYIHIHIMYVQYAHAHIQNVCVYVFAGLTMRTKSLHSSKNLYIKAKFIPYVEWAIEHFGDNFSTVVWELLVDYVRPMMEDEKKRLEGAE